MGSPEDKLQALLDREAIRDVLNRYAQAVDRWDRAVLATVFAPDAILHLGVYDGPASAMLGASRNENLLATQHNVSNIQVKLEGDRARAVTYVNAVHLMHHDGRVYHEMFRSRYLDCLVRHDDDWRITERTIAHDWRMKLPASDEDVEVNGLWRTGRDGAEDPSFGFLDWHVGGAPS